ncbi:expressed protein [Echinococcus multilocularis]|uniref:Expressed protein n=1 Tax=Echinococcus multilocularis TaxID=6211 RepID=A0A068YBB1_ECHMU|nr:expressed protein [Echinococcus multilocularis]
MSRAHEPPDCFFDRLVAFGLFPTDSQPLLPLMMLILPCSASFAYKKGSHFSATKQGAVIKGPLGRNFLSEFLCESLSIRLRKVVHVKWEKSAQRSSSINN